MGLPASAVSAEPAGGAAKNANRSPRTGAARMRGFLQRDRGSKGGRRQYRLKHSARTVPRHLTSASLAYTGRMRMDRAERRPRVLRTQYSVLRTWYSTE